MVSPIKIFGKVSVYVKLPPPIICKVATKGAPGKLFSTLYTGHPLNVHGISLQRYLIDTACFL